MEKDPVQYGTRLRPFDPSACGGDFAQAFERFIHLYTYRYQASDRRPPTSVEDTEGWVAKDKWKTMLRIVCWMT